MRSISSKAVCSITPEKSGIPEPIRRGKGEFQVNNQIFSIEEGSIVRVDPQGERCMRNISKTEDLCWIVIQSRVDSHPDCNIQDGIGIQRRVSWTK